MKNAFRFIDFRRLTAGIVIAYYVEASTAPMPHFKELYKELYKVLKNRL